MGSDVIRSLVRGAYDIQGLRIQMGNRIVANWKAKLGVKPSQKEEDADADAKKIMSQLRASFEKMTDGVLALPKPKDFKGDELISSYTELSLIAQYLELEGSEDRHFQRLGHALKGIPIYDRFLSKIPGCGPAMSGVIVSEIDIRMAKYPSSLWQYAGLGVEADNRGTSRRKEHLKEVYFIPKDRKKHEDPEQQLLFEETYARYRNPIERRSLTGADMIVIEDACRHGFLSKRTGLRHNPFLKTKLMGVLAGGMLRAGMKTQKNDEGEKVVNDEGKSIPLYDECSHYVKQYINYKNRLRNTEKFMQKTDDGKRVFSDAHINMMALRYMIKRFLVDLHVEWRKLEGLEVSTEYNEGKLGHKH